jgi:SAM-dependent methyltransferase
MAESRTHTVPDLEFWRTRYREGRMMWDLGEPSAPARGLAERYLRPRSRVFIPGCGRGHEALLLARQGHSVLAVDFAPEPIAALGEAARAAGLTLDLRQADLFTLPADLDGTCDAVLEQACLCAVGPTRYADYEALAGRLLKPNGRLLAVLMEAALEHPPPFSIPPAAALALFCAPRWKLETLEPVRPQNPRRPGPEYTAVFVKTG